MNNKVVNKNSFLYYQCILINYNKLFYFISKLFAIMNHFDLISLQKLYTVSAQIVS